jgi:hypothetical protein
MLASLSRSTRKGLRNIGLIGIAAAFISSAAEDKPDK